MFLYFAFSIGIELDFTAVSSLLILILIFSIMATKVNNMKNSINMTNVLCVVGCGAQLESPIYSDCKK